MGNPKFVVVRYDGRYLSAYGGWTEYLDRAKWFHAIEDAAVAADGTTGTVYRAMYGQSAMWPVTDYAAYAAS